MIAVSESYRLHQISLDRCIMHEVGLLLNLLLCFGVPRLLLPPPVCYWTGAHRPSRNQRGHEAHGHQHGPQEPQAERLKFTCRTDGNGCNVLATMLMIGGFWWSLCCFWREDTHPLSYGSCRCWCRCCLGGGSVAYFFPGWDRIGLLAYLADFLWSI